MTLNGMRKPIEIRKCNVIFAKIQVQELDMENIMFIYMLFTLMI